MRETHLSLMMALLFAGGLAGCDRSPKLTHQQVEQVFETQGQLVEQQASLSRSRDDLEADRRVWAERQRRDPIIAQAISATGLLIACCLPLWVIVLLLRGSDDSAKISPHLETLLAETQTPPPKQPPSIAQRRSQTNQPAD